MIEVISTYNTFIGKIFSKSNYWYYGIDTKYGEDVAEVVMNNKLFLVGVNVADAWLYDPDFSPVKVLGHDKCGRLTSLMASNRVKTNSFGLCIYDAMADGCGMPIH